MFCPACKTELSLRPKSIKEIFSCPNCGTGLRLRPRKTPPFFWLLPPILDILWLAISNSIYLKSADAIIVSDAPASFRPSPEKIAFNEIMKSAATGDAAMQYKLGKAYEDGHGIDRNDAAAMSWFLKSAHQGYADAQNAVARMYFTGQGYQRNYEEAYFWYRLAEETCTIKECSKAARKYLSATQAVIVEKRISSKT
jgi:TPR repeat protein